jgi:hypothetical protein
MTSVRVPSAFNVSGPLVYAVARGWRPIAVVLRDAQGKTVSRVPLANTLGGCTS